MSSAQNTRLEAAFSIGIAFKAVAFRFAPQPPSAFFPFFLYLSISDGGNVLRVDVRLRSYFLILFSVSSTFLFYFIQSHRLATPCPPISSYSHSTYTHTDYTTYTTLITQPDKHFLSIELSTFFQIIQSEKFIAMPIRDNIRMLHLNSVRA